VLVPAEVVLKFLDHMQLTFKLVIRHIPAAVSSRRARVPGSRTCPVAPATQNRCRTLEYYHVRGRQESNIKSIFRDSSGTSAKSFLVAILPRQEPKLITSLFCQGWNSTFNMDI